ncbi:hypothetical protein Tco_0005909 [Tanacetum coccineum]
MITNSTTMAVLESCPKHNMVAYIEKIEWNEEFHEVIDFLARSSIHNALTVSPVVSTTFVEQFWMSAKSKIINNVRYITAKVAGKPVSISEASIRSDLLFDDANGIDSLPNQAIFDAIQYGEYLVGIHGGQSSSDNSLLGNEGDMHISRSSTEAILCNYHTSELGLRVYLEANDWQEEEILEVKLDEKRVWWKSFTAVGSTEDERRIKEMNEGVKDTDQKKLKEEDTTKVPAKVEVTEQGTKKRKGGHIKMIARKKPRKQSDQQHNKHDT